MTGAVSINPRTGLHALRYAGRTLLSALPLPSLPRAPTSAAAPASLHIAAPIPVTKLQPRSDWLHEWRDGSGGICLQLAALQLPECYLLRTPGLCDFRIDCARGTVEIEHTPATDSDTLEHLLIDQVLPRLLAQQGSLVAHAGCIRIHRRGALFMGQTGWGKSTLTALLQRHGHVPISDDCAVLDIHDQQVLATATYPSLRLFDDSIRAGFDRVPDATPVASYTGKRRIRLDAPPTDQPTPVSAIYLLNNPARPMHAPAIVPLPAAVACMALIEHGFRLDIASAERSAQQLRHAAAITRLVPTYALHYPRDFASADAVVERVLKHFGGLDVETKAIDCGP